jgi:zinc transport system permease protein
MILLFSVLLGMIFAPLSCVVVWKRYAYLGDGLVHSSMLAAALHIMTKIPIEICLCFSTSFFYFVLNILNFKENKNNEITYIVSGLMTSLALISGDEEEFEHILFGDISNITQTNIYIEILCILVVYAFIYLYKRDIILSSINSEIAKSQGINVKKTDSICILIVVLIVAIHIPIVGGFLIPALLLIPSMTVFNKSSTPNSMLIYSTFVAVFMNLFGKLISDYFQIKTTPSIIIFGFILFLFSRILRIIRK